MAFYKHEGVEGPKEGDCPVCYESRSGAERTLSCGHAFCHDCLVRTLLVSGGGGPAATRRDGPVGDTIVCPVCRHLTFIRKRGGGGGGEEEAPPPLEQTLEVPVGDTDWSSSPSLDRNASQIFIISAQGRPMAEEEDALSVVAATAAEAAPPPPHVRRRRIKICTTGRCLLLLLSVFTLLALVAATLPWILLA
ncbi:unnamed protein product [Merluccius merluccius]